MPGVVLAGGVDALTVEPEDPVEERRNACGDQRCGAEATEPTRAQRVPETNSERDDQHPGQIRPELVVEPRASRRQCAEVGDVVVGGAERRRLSEVAGDPADVER